MLSELNIRNLALIDTLQVHLEPGFNVFTGETGAGKSILINAIGLAVGDKGSPELVKSGTDLATVDALFEIDNPSAGVTLLSDLGIELDSQELAVDGRAAFVITRELGTRSRCRINDRPVTLQTLKAMGQLLVDLHGQHEHQSLLRPAQHLEFLDQLGGADVRELRETVRALHRSRRALQEEILRITANDRDRAQRLDLLQYQIREIDSARLEPNEEAPLSEDCSRLRNAEQLRAAAGSILSALSDETADASLVSALGHSLAVCRESSSMDSAFKDIGANLETAYYHLEDAQQALRDYLEALQADPARLEEIESRLHLISQLKRKYGDDVEGILAHRDTIAAELELLTNSDERLVELQRQTDELEKDLACNAERLSEARREVSKTFQKSLLAHLKELAMEKARFDTRIAQVEDERGIRVNGQRVRVGEKGIDEVEFLIAPNAGQPLKPLARIASGGELSRLMLALKSTLSQRHEIPTLVFDEIDVGIGGATAEAVGRKLKRLSGFAQVLCVTHLPQIACLADAHFLVEKTSTKSETSVALRRLGDSERIEELARMLGGSKPSETVRQHARELIAGVEP